MNYFLLIIFFFLEIMFVSSYNKFPRRPDKYLSYNKVKQVFSDIYKLDNPKEYSIEHIVPQSNFKDNKLLKCDMHNLLYYPSKLNLHRSNYKYISDFKLYETSVLLDSLGNKVKFINKKNDDYSIKTSEKKIFLPPEKYRGSIARSSMYFLTTYTEFENIILDKVIDPYTLLTWHHMYPVTDYEKEKELKISECQGNSNIFIKEPRLLVDYMEDILKVNLIFYKDNFFEII